MRRSLLLVAAAMALPLASAESQSSRRRNSDSTESMGSVLRAAASAGVGLGAGLMYAFGGDDYDTAWESWYGGRNTATRRNTPASLVQSDVGFFRGAPLGSDEMSERPENVSFAQDGNGQAGSADDASAAVMVSNIRRLANRMSLVADRVEGLRNSRIRTERPAAERYTSAGPAGGVGGGGAGMPYVMPVTDMLVGAPGSEFGDDPLGNGAGSGDNGVGGAAELDVIVNPEPGTVVLTVVGLGMLLGLGRRNRRRTA